MKLKLKNKNPEDIQRLLNEAFLNIYVEDKKLFNPLLIPEGVDTFDWFTWILSRPEYFYLICKEVLGIELIPMQGIILKKLWTHRFPMLIMSRGGSKLLRPDAKLRIQNGWTTMEQIKVGDKVYGSDGKLCNVIHKTNIQKNVDMYRITLRDGRAIECCSDHQWKVWDKNINRNRYRNNIGEYIWSTRTTKELFDSYYINRTGKKTIGVEFRYALPINSALEEETESDLLLHPYIVGVLLGDGCLTQKQITISSLDKELVERFAKYLPNGYILTTSDNKNYRIIRENKDLPGFWKLCKKIGIWQTNSKTKFIPDCYKFTIYNNKLELIKGLIDTDGSSHHATVKYDTISDRLANDFLDIARSLGLACRRMKRQVYLNNIRYSDCNSISIYTNIPIASLTRKLQYLNYNRTKQSYSKTEKTFITNIEYIGKGEGYCIQVDSSDHTYITDDYIVTHNSFCLAIYALLRAILIPNRKVLISGASFRQSKVIFNYIERIWSNSPILRDIGYSYSNDAGPHRNADLWYFNIGSSIISAIPVGPGGDKIRGQRAHDLIIDEFNTVPCDVFETVMAGFTAVSSDPIANVKEEAMKKLAEEEGIELQEYIDLENKYIMPNQLVISGTSGYTFDHFYKYWQNWHDIIGSKGDRKKLERYLAKQKEHSEQSEEEIFSNLDYKDYCIVRIPYELIPKGFMDAAQIARARATMHNGTYLCEYAACLTNKNELILTDKGYKKWIDIQIGDLVLTDQGRFRPVTKKTYQYYNGIVYDIYGYGTNFPMSVTANHPFLFNGKYRNFQEDKYLELCKLKSLSNLNIIDLSKYIDNGIIFDDHIYTKYPNQKISQTQIDLVISLSKENKKQIEIEKLTDIKQSKISYILKNNKKRKKCSINRYINLDYYFGLIIGYYAAEGSIGALGRQCNFALGRIETDYIDELQDAISRVFNIKSHSYIKEEVCSVTVNSRIFSEIMSKICKGNCYTKIVDPEILYSNESFIRGFLKGIFNGDGCNHKTKVSTLGLSSLSLISQVRTLLTYFNIYSSLYYKESCQQIICNRLCNINERYKLDIRCDYLKLFRKIIYNKDIVYNGKSFNKDNNDSFYIHTKKIKSYHYNGLVYNLEVADDHTYCLSNATCHNCFPDDSNGFFRRSVINKATVSPKSCISHAGYEEICFSAVLYGNPGCQYIFGVDPASETDNFAITIIELYKNHRRLVYTWTTNKKQHEYEIKKGLTERDDYFAYCILKIRDLMKRFQCVRIMVDSQGGGATIREGLMNDRLIRENEQKIFEVIDDNKEKETDILDGLHILELCNFSSADWVAEANNGLRFDLERRILLFPYFDAVSLAIAEGSDQNSDRIYDSLEYNMLEIEELKDELTSIIKTQTPTGKDKWETPEVKLSGGRKGKQRKDRYSALLMSNMGARKLMNDITFRPEMIPGGIVGRVEAGDGQLFKGNEVINAHYQQIYHLFG